MKDAHQQLTHVCVLSAAVVAAWSSTSPSGLAKARAASDGAADAGVPELSGEHLTKPRAASDGAADAGVSGLCANTTLQVNLLV